MAVPDLTPISQTSRIVLPATGSVANVDSANDPLPFGIYTSVFWSAAQVASYSQGSADQVTYVYKKLGGDVLDLEITESQVHAAYEESVLEYSYLLNIHQSKNILSNVLGQTTGSYDSDGEILGALGEVQPGDNVNLIYPKFDFAYARRIADGISEEVNVGGNHTVYSASFDVVAGQQDYDLQNIIRASSEYGDDNTDPDWIRSVGNGKILIKKVFWKTPRSMWHFYGMHGGTNVIGNWESYGHYANASFFHVVPVWESKLAMSEFEDRLYNRYSHFSYELKNQKLRLFPMPVSYQQDKMWVEFAIPVDNWVDEPLDAGDVPRDIGLAGINNINTIPFANLPYDRINAIGKQWIRRFALSLAKEMLGYTRSKFATIPIPGNDISMNGADLVSQAQTEQEALRTELKELLDEMTYSKLIEGDADLLENSNRIQGQIPMPIFVG